MCIAKALIETATDCISRAVHSTRNDRTTRHELYMVEGKTMTNPARIAQREIEVGTRWKCMVCNHVQDPITDEEWPYHCDKLMRIVRWYSMRGVSLP